MTSKDGMSKIHGSAPTRGRRVAPLAKEAEVEQWQERLPHGSQTPFMISAQRPARNLVSAGSGDGEDGDCDIRREIRAEIQKAVECLIKDLETLLLFFDFPADHWDHLRTKNPIVKRVCDGQASHDRMNWGYVGAHLNPPVLE